MGKIFISYRQDDTRDHSEAIYAKLCGKFGMDRVYKDVHTIPKGVHFEEHIMAHLSDALVFLELIGPNWVNAADQNGHARLHDPHDLLHQEILKAFHTKLPIIPVFIKAVRNTPCFSYGDASTVARGDPVPVGLTP